ncbi:MAG: hypothetical protein U0324_26655 [Polyangiales bacterium]
MNARALGLAAALSAAACSSLVAGAQGQGDAAAPDVAPDAVVPPATGSCAFTLWAGADDGPWQRPPALLADGDGRALLLVDGESGRVLRVAMDAATTTRLAPRGYPAGVYGQRLAFDPVRRQVVALIPPSDVALDGFGRYVLTLDARFEAWTSAVTVNSVVPSARGVFASTFDPVGRRFRVVAGAPLAAWDLPVVDPYTWREQGTAEGPRLDFTDHDRPAVWDATRGGVVLLDDARAPYAVWTLGDPPGSWRRLPATVAPFADERASLAWDASRGVAYALTANGASARVTRLSPDPAVSPRAVTLALNPGFRVLPEFAIAVAVDAPGRYLYALLGEAYAPWRWRLYRAPVDRCFP